MRHLQNAWYMIGWDSELTPGSLLARTLAERPIVVFRNPDNDLVALEDTCPHRFAPLSMGTIRDGNIYCGYHGLGFGPDGQCVHNPHGPVLRAASVHSYPVLEQNGILWVWLGDPNRARSSSPPDFSFLDATPDTAKRAGYMHTQANYELCVDNILDLSHADFMHPGSLGGGATTRTRSQAEDDGDCVSLHWNMKDETPLPFISYEFPGHDRLDQWLDVRWMAPGVMYLEAGGGLPGRSREESINTFNLHIMMPETEVTTHYFYCNTRNYKQHDTAYHSVFSDALQAAFQTEDKPMLEAQQRRVGSRQFMAMKPLLLPSDHGTVRVRRKLESMISAEEAQA